MSNEREGSGPEGKKVRVRFRRNRSPRARDKDWTEQGRNPNDAGNDASSSEQIVPRGDISRQRTVIVRDNDPDPALRKGVVVAMRGLFAEVDDGEKIWNCTVRRILRTRQIDERGPVVAGDKVRFRVEPTREGVADEGAIELVEPRGGQLRRLAHRRIQTIVANVDQAIIVASAGHPDFKPHLIDRYIVAALYGGITPVVCLNKIDLDEDHAASDALERYEALNYRTLRTNVPSGAGIDELREVLREKESVIAGQSGVGKSSLLNAVQPGLGLKIGDVIHKYDKGRHTTTTATLLRLEFGGYVVDTPGIRGLDLSIVPRGELEAYFVEMIPHIPNCKFPDCSHTHEIECAVKAAVERGEIHPERFESYVRLLTEPVPE